MFDNASAMMSVVKVLANFNKLLSRAYSTNRLVRFYDSAKDALHDVKDGSRVLLGGFGVCGIPENLIQSLVDVGTKNLTVLTNNSGQPDWGVGKLIRRGRVKRLISSYVGENHEVEQQFLSGDLELEITPQGNLAERLRAGSAGIPAFFTPTGVGTLVQHGGIPMKYDHSGKITMVSQPKKCFQFNGVDYLMEEAFIGDFALVKGWKADRRGNVIFRKTARNFNPIMCKAAKVAIVEVEEIVENGQIDADNVHLPSIYVDRVVHGYDYEKRVAKLVTSIDDDTGEPDEGNAAQETQIRLTIAKRAAREFKEGMYVNLGVGIPNLCLMFIPKDVDFTIQSENGVLGLGPYPKTAEVDPDLVNAGKETATILPGAAFFSSDDSFAMIRGSHIDLTVLGALQVSQNGDLANWMIPGKKIKGMGGAMDLVSALGAKVLVTMEHCSRKGEFKVLSECQHPLTGRRVVDTIITEKCVFKVDKGNGLTLTELAEGITLEDVRKHTGCDFKVSADLKKDAY